MKCGKCGEECKENQAFCLKCGNPIQVVPDFNLIEAELASNIGELMDQIDSENINDENTRDNDTIKEVSVDDMELKLVDISRHSQDDKAEDKTKIIGDISHLVKEVNDTEEVQPRVLPNESEPPQNKKSKKKIAVICSIIAAVLIIAVIVFVVVAQSVESSATSYEEYYDNAKTAYEKMNTDDALDDAKKALDKASNASEKLKARELIYDIHILAGEKGQAYADNLAEIAALNSKDSKYYVALAKYYYEAEEYDKLTELLIGVEEENILEALSQYVVKEPKADFESGDYTAYMAVTITAEDGYEIYYTTDSRNPSNYGEKYSEPIQITKEGETVIKAIAVNDKGVESKVVTYTYNVQLAGSNAPKITPSGGAYDAYTKIKIEVPEGGKAYYTWDGTEPTDKSSEYTEEIDMLRGINVLKVIVIDKYGITSQTAQESYNLQIPRAISLNDGVALVEEEAKKSIAEEEILKVEYETTTVIDNNEFYIINATVSDSDGKIKTLTIYAVNTFDKTISVATDEEGQYSIKTEDSSGDN